MVFVSETNAVTPYNDTNTALVVPLGGAATDITLLAVSAKATGTDVDPALSTPSGWQRWLYSFDAGSPGTLCAVFSKECGDASVNLAWTVPGQCVASALVYSDLDLLTPFLDVLPWVKVANDTAWDVPVDITAAGTVVGGIATRVGTAQFSAPSDTVRSSPQTGGSGSGLLVQEGQRASAGTSTISATGTTATSVGSGFSLRLNPKSGGGGSSGAPVFAWNGTAWVPGTTRLWDGSHWTFGA